MYTEMLKGKRILMFSNSFFNYNEMIVSQLKELGCIVDLYDERPNNHVLTKIMLRYNIKLIRPKVNSYYKRIIEENKTNQYDYIFVIKSESITPKIIRNLREAFPKAEVILYLWDAIANVPEGKKKLSFYDKVLTFDPIDAKNYGLKLRPLFYAKDFENLDKPSKNYKYDMSFIGTAHSIRPKIVSILEEQCKKQNRKCYSFLFLPHKIVFLYNKLLNRDYSKVKLSDISFSPLSAKEINDIYSQTRCVLDVEHKNQKGLTMRTFELLGMQKKIITTNPQIENYDFYNQNNICIIDRNNPQVPESFWDSEFIPVPKEILENYSLKHFIFDIFIAKGE